MKIITADQRSDEWFAARRGRITGSEVYMCLMARDTKGRSDYVQKLADDIEGVPDFNDVDPKPWFTDGIYYESFARGWYSYHEQVDVEEVGLIVSDEYDFIACSPDGIMRERERGVEIKFRKSLRTFKEHTRVDVLPRPIRAQIQHSMLVTGWQSWDYVNYWRDDDNGFEKGHVRTIRRDDAFIENELLPGIVNVMSDVRHVLRLRGVSVSD